MREGVSERCVWRGVRRSERVDKKDEVRECKGWLATSAVLNWSTVDVFGCIRRE